MCIARAAERLATAQSGPTHSTWADSCFCSDRAQPCQVAVSKCTGWSWGATWTMGGGGSGSRHCGAELHTAACNRPAHPTLACVCMGWAMKIDATLLLEDQTKLFVPILCDVGVLIFCQPIIHHQSMSNAFSLVCCACTLPACSPLLAVRARHLPTHAHLKCNSLVFKNMPAANCLGVDI